MPSLAWDWGGWKQFCERRGGQLEPPGQLRMSSPSSSCSNNWWRGCAKIRGQAKLCHRVDEAGGHIQPQAPLTGAVVVREGVMVVVETLTHRQHWHKPFWFRAYKTISILPMAFRENFLSEPNSKLRKCWKKVAPVLSRANVLIIRFHPKHVSGGVDQPGEVEDIDIPQVEMRGREWR